MTINILSAGSLKAYFDKLIIEYQQIADPIEFKLEYTGSLECVRKVYKGQAVDIIAVADDLLLQYLVQERIIFDYQLLASNEMVICFTDKSKYAKEITSNNWFHFLISDQVKLGHTSPDLDPAGYRALLVLKLAQEYYAETRLFQNFMDKENRQVFSNASFMVDELINGHLDYIFEYYSVAKNNNLNFIKLPNPINLSIANEANYARAQVKVNSYKNELVTIKGAPITYAFAILPHPKHHQVKEFATFMHSKSAAKILSLCNLNPLFR